MSNINKAAIKIIQAKRMNAILAKLFTLPLPQGKGIPRAIFVQLQASASPSYSPS